MTSEKRHRVPRKMTERARDLRREATFPERLLWSRLWDGQLEGTRFRRQHVIGSYVVNFYCAKHNFVIELDGHSHDTTAKADLQREEYLKGKGCQIIRFRNDEVVEPGRAGRRPGVTMFGRAGG